jgi:hypothetical protein
MAVVKVMLLKMAYYVHVLKRNRVTIITSSKDDIRYCGT